MEKKTKKNPADNQEIRPSFLLSQKKSLTLLGHFTRLAIIVLLVSPMATTSWSFDQVSPLTGKVTVTQTDQHLKTPIGLIPVIRTFRSNQEPGILGLGWSLDIISRLGFLGDNRLVIMQAGQQILLSQKSNTKIFEGVGGWQAQLNDRQWIVQSPTSVTSIYDYQGKIISHTNRNGNTITFTHDQQGRLFEIQAVKGYPLRLLYDQKSLLSAIQDFSGRQCEYRYDKNGRLIEVKDADGWKTFYEYAKDGKLAEINYPSGEKVTFRYDNSARVIERGSSTGIRYSYSYGPTTRITRQDGVWWETTYSEKGLPVKARDSLNNERTWIWVGRGQLIAERFQDGSSMTYTYDSLGRLVRQQTDRGDVTQNAYEANSQRPIETDYNGAITRLTYDGKGNLLSITSPAGRKTSYTYDKQGRMISVTDGERRTTQFEYDLMGNLIKQINSDGGVISWDYDAKGQLAREHDPEGNITTYHYQANGLLSSITAPGGNHIAYQYDTYGRLIKAMTGARINQYTYDPKGLLARIDFSDKNYMKFSYDSLGNMVESVDTFGNMTRNEYDRLGRLTKTTLPSGVSIGASFSKSGNLESLHIGQSTLNLVYDDGGRMIRLKDHIGGEVRLIKDRWGRVIQRISPGGGQEQRKYDLDGFLETITLPMGDAWNFKHNKANQIQEIILPEGNKQKFIYDGGARLSSIIDSLGNTTKYHYNKVGFLIEKTNARVQKINYKFDQTGKLIIKQTPQETWNFQYDIDGNLIQVTNGKLTVRHTYNNLGRHISTEYPEWNKMINYQYDHFGRMVTRIDPDGNQTRYFYDKLGRTERIEGPDRQAFTFTYDKDGNLIGRKASNGTAAQYKYDDSGRIVSINHLDAAGKVLISSQYRYDMEGNCVEVIDERENKNVYRYDLEQRLISEASPSDRKTYVYGPGGNRLSTYDKSGSTVYQYDKAGRLVQAGEVFFTYDADGNLISRKEKTGVTRYHYDAEGNLIRAELPGGKTVVYGYGPFGERIWREEDGNRIYYLLDGYDLLQELSSDFKPLSTYLYSGLDQPLMVRFANGNKNIFHQDALGTVLGLSDAKGRISVRYIYDAFGNSTHQEVQALAQPLRFTGRPLDSTTGLYDFRARFYDPKLGRFISRDPVLGNIDDPVSLSPYLYVRNNPLRYVDRSGAAPESPLLLPSGRTPSLLPGGSSPLALSPGVSPLSLPAGSPSLSLPPGRTPLALPSGNHPLALPSGNQPLALPGGSPPLALPAGSPPLSLPPGRIPLALPPGNQPLALPPGNQLLLPPANRSIQVPLPEIPLDPGILSRSQRFTTRWGPFATNVRNLGQPMPIDAGGPGGASPATTVGEGLGGAIQLSNEILQWSTNRNLTNSYIPNRINEITQKYPADEPIRIRVAYTGGDWIYPTSAVVQDLGPQPHHYLTDQERRQGAIVRSLDDDVRKIDQSTPLPKDTIQGPTGDPYAPTSVVTGTGPRPQSEQEARDRAETERRIGEEGQAIPYRSRDDIIRRYLERQQMRDQQVRDQTSADASRWTGETKQPPVIPTPEDPRGPGGPKVQTPPGGTGTTTPTKTGETPPPKPPVKPDPPPTSTIKPSTVDFPDSSGRFKIMVHFPKGAGKSYKNEKVGNDNVIVIMCPGYSQFVSNEPVELSVLGSGIGKWTVYAIRDLRDPTTRRLLQTLSSMSSDAYYYVVIYDSNRNELSRTYFKVRGTK